MKNNPKQLFSFLQSMGGIAWEADAGMRQYSFIGDNDQYIFGFSPETWRGYPGFWESRIHPDDKEVVSGYLNLNDQPGKTHTFEYRILGADGNIVWVKDNVSVTSGDNALPVLRGIMQDTTAARRLSAMEQLERNVLQLNSDINISLRELLLSYLSGLEKLFPLMLCSILRVKSGRLYEGVSPSLPAAYMAAIDNLLIGENKGSCGSSAVSKKQVIVSDISTDPKWADYRDLALSHQLRACWSNPVIDTEGAM